MSENKVALFFNFKMTLFSDIFWSEQNWASYGVSVRFMFMKEKSNLMLMINDKLLGN